MMSRSALRNVMIALLGSGVGAMFLWLALREIRLDELTARVAELDYRQLLLAAGLYWLALGGRILRWQLLLRELAEAPLRAVAETLIVGYAVNNVLPARLGEVARAAYAKRRLKIGRARVFGSIVIERVLDLAAILTCLASGLIALRLSEAGARLPIFEVLALNAGAIIGVIILAIGMLRSGTLGRFRLPQPAATVIADFRRGIATLNRHSIVYTVALTLIVWAFETAALAAAFAAVDVHLSVPQALLVMGAASLSTLVPTAPGYLGTYQLVAVIAMNAFGFSDSAGIVAAGAIQVVLFGSVTLAGLLVMVMRGLRRLSARLAPGAPRTH